MPLPDASVPSPFRCVTERYIHGANDLCKNCIKFILEVHKASLAAGSRIGGVTRTRTMKLGGGIELRITRHEDESITFERVNGPLTIRPAAERARMSEVPRDRMVITPAEAKRPSRF